MLARVIDAKTLVQPFPTIAVGRCWRGELRARGVTARRRIVRRRALWFVSGMRKSGWSQPISGRSQCLLSAARRTIAPFIARAIFDAHCERVAATHALVVVAPRLPRVRAIFANRRIYRARGPQLVGDPYFFARRVLG